eukprot:6213874-Pleurochrysis_carterae.AAC.2
MNTEAKQVQGSRCVEIEMEHETNCGRAGAPRLVDEEAEKDGFNRGVENAAATRATRRVKSGTNCDKGSNCTCGASASQLRVRSRRCAAECARLHGCEREREQVRSLMRALARIALTLETEGPARQSRVRLCVRACVPVNVPRCVRELE